uniref:Cytochrome b5 reductase 4 n=1 Tax=Timema genevievae TaxID=629358 RepID=A0A7R9JZI6_TIMGE|nr:unnamed protein product [Timema genevievae]
MSYSLKNLKLEESGKKELSANGSATGNPRNKVALQPGHSLMDWVRLGQSGKDLTGVKGVLQDVTVAQLAKHNKRHDAWLAIRGRVYNVSHYMDFHPGGEEELMRRVGKDATDLFNQVHAWVNFESLLQKCLVGRLRKNEGSKLDLGVLLFGSKKSNTGAKQVPVLPGPTVAEDSKPKGRVPVPMDWFQKQDVVSVVYYTKVTCPVVEVRLVDGRDLSVYVRLGDTDTLLSHLSLEEEVSWPCKVSTNDDTGKIELQLVKKLPKLWSRLGAECSDNGTMHSNTDVFAPFSAYIVAGVTPVTHNTKLLVLRRRDCVYRTVPIGHHVREYPAGALTPWLCSLCPGDTVELSGPEGSFSTKLLAETTSLYLVAAGTGLTPMLALIVWALERRGGRSLKISLIFFNRDEKDQLWSEQLKKLDQENERFTVTHVLSEASDDWVGRRGHIDESFLQELLPDIASDPTQFVCVCGPTAFTELTRKWCGVDDDDAPFNTLSRIAVAASVVALSKESTYQTYLDKLHYDPILSYTIVEPRKRKKKPSPIGDHILIQLGYPRTPLTSATELERTSRSSSQSSKRLLERQPRAL